MIDETDKNETMLSEKILQKHLELTNDLRYKDQVKICDLDYPCNDKSSGVSDFSQWSYFKRHKVIVNESHSCTWSKPFLERIKDQRFYDQTIPSWDPNAKENRNRNKPKQSLRLLRKERETAPPPPSRGNASAGKGSRSMVGIVGATYRPPRKRSPGKSPPRKPGSINSASTILPQIPQRGR